MKQTCILTVLPPLNMDVMKLMTGRDKMRGLIMMVISGCHHHLLF